MNNSMMRNVLLAIVSIGMLNMASQAAISVEFSGDNSGVTQYTKMLLDERLDSLAKDQNQVNLIIHLNISSEFSHLGDEGYHWEIKKGNVFISAASDRGVLYGAVDFVEWVMQRTSPYLVDSNQVDIDFKIASGQAKDFLNNLPDYTVTEKPFYSIRGIDMQLGLGVADLTDSNKADQFACPYSKVSEGFRDSSKEWKKWCDWLARHKMNFIGNWPYSCGTNWWELAYDPATEKMTQYSAEEIKNAAIIREELLKYAKDRGLTPYLMNYVLGAPNPIIAKNYPELIGPKGRPDWPAAFCMSSPDLKEKFVAQIRAIVKAYPSLGGLHLRWWGESFPCSCPKCAGKCHELLQDYTLAIINSALEIRPDLEIRITGWIRNGGTKEFAARLPKKVIIQTKWGFDWEPTSFPNVPYSKITEVNQRFLISQALPGEEFHPIGSVQYKGLEAGMRQYSNDKSKIPNLDGFSVVAGEKDHEWITGMNYVAAARLNWNPIGTNCDMLAKNYIASQLCLTQENAAIVDNIWLALDLTQGLWEPYCCDFGGVSYFIDCNRFHDLFGLKRVKKLNGEILKKALPQMFQHSESMEKAMKCINSAQKCYAKIGKPGRPEFLEDISIQTKIFERFFKSRVLMIQAFISLDNKDFDLAEMQLQEMKKMDQQLLQATTKKSNISDYFEFEGMSRPIHVIQRANAEIKEIDDMLKEIIKLKNTHNN